MTELGKASPAVAMPKVSVIMGTFNCRETIGEAIASIQAQTYSNWELVVCDDGSSDGTYELLQVMARKLGTKMVLLRNDTNSKLAYSLNRCIQASSGDYLARMDGDDRSVAERFDKQIGFLQSHPHLSVVGTGMQRFNDAGLGDVLRPMTDPKRDTLGRGRFAAPFFHATIMARRAMFDEIGGYTVSWRTERCEDVDLWFKFFHAGLSGANLDEPLYHVREDAAAIRRRTPRSRVQVFATLLHGNRLLGYPARAYVRSIAALLKILVPYRVFDWHREFQRNRFLREHPVSSPDSEAPSHGHSDDVLNGNAD